jgi:(1->4)-alpha-D-glucan 1-alpha-D-glucosylmutase
MLDEMLRTLEDGRAKLYLIWRTLNFRKAHEDLFAQGAYLPLDTTGLRQQHLIAFARRLGAETIVVAAARWFTALIGERGGWPATGFDWGDTQLVLPGPGAYRHLFSAEVIETDEEAPAVGAETLFRRFPAALLVLTPLPTAAPARAGAAAG